MTFTWTITHVEPNENEICLSGYTFQGPQGRKSLLHTKITKMNLNTFMTEYDHECHEGRSLVLVNPNECQLIENDMFAVESASDVEKFIAKEYLPESFKKLVQCHQDTYQEMQKKDGISCFECVSKNVFIDEYYLGMPPIVYMTWIGMIICDI